MAKQRNGLAGVYDVLAKVSKIQKIPMTKARRSIQMAPGLTWPAGTTIEWILSEMQKAGQVEVSEGFVQLRK